MPRPSRSPWAPAVILVLLLTGCSSQDRADPPPAPEPEPTVITDPLIGAGLDVCRLPSAAMVRRAAGQDGSPVSRTLTSLRGYDGLLDECGFGSAFRSLTFAVAVGLAPAGPRVLARLPGRPVQGVGDGARAAVVDGRTTLTFLKGRTLVRVGTVVTTDGPSRLPRLTEVARGLVDRVPGEPPEADDQARGRCSEVRPRLVDRVLGGASQVSRGLDYQDGSATCAWASGTTAATTVLLSLYTNRQAGPFLADLKNAGPSTTVRGVDGDAFTTPEAAYVVAEDGQAVVLAGTFGAGRTGRTPLPVTPALTALLADAGALLK